MKVISFYSFKGGTGRTTATANVAAELARRNKNVVVVDLDIEGPGLEIVLGVKEKIPLYIQDYLKDPAEANLKTLIYDLKRAQQFRRYRGSFCLIAANLEVQSPVDATSDIVHTIISDLIRTLRQSATPRIDYCLIDSQSGYGDLAATVLDISDHLFLLTKFSRQHIIGTVVYHELLHHLMTKRNLELDFDVVVSVVPEITNKTEKKLRDEYISLIHKNTHRDVLIEIPDSRSLKWREEVVIGKSLPGEGDVTKAFRVIAQRCMAL